MPSTCTRQRMTASWIWPTWIWSSRARILASHPITWRLSSPWPSRWSACIWTRTRRRWWRVCSWRRCNIGLRSSRPISFGIRLKSQRYHRYCSLWGIRGNSVNSQWNKEFNQNHFWTFDTSRSSFWVFSCREICKEFNFCKSGEKRFRFLSKFWPVLKMNYLIESHGHFFERLLLRWKHFFLKRQFVLPSNSKTPSRLNKACRFWSGPKSQVFEYFFKDPISQIF